MSKPARITTVVFLVAGAFVAGNLTRRRTVPASATSSRRVLYWACPMHSEYKSDRSGDCPSCGMRLEAVYDGDAATAGGPSGRPGLIQVSAAKQQLIGVRTNVVERSSNASVLRVAGRIGVDDSRLYRLIAPNDGWVRELGTNPAGTFVKKDAILASYYVKDLVTTQQSYLYALDSYNQYEQKQLTNPLQRTTATVNLRQALDSLRSLGMPDGQVEELRRTHTAASELRLYSPVTGFVLARNLSPAQRFDKGAELYRIADLSHVWVTADIFEKDREFIAPGTRATVRYRGRELTARLSDALPQFDQQSRTLKTRFELDNSGNLLWPDMFVDVEIHVNMPAGITVPADAVIESGLRKTVYVASGDGFEPRTVKTGWRFGERVQIAEGLQSGERIVASGTFLIDSESRMRLASAGITAAPDRVAGKDPVCGMELDRAASIQSKYHGKSYVFCSLTCKKNFEAAPAKYVPADHATADAQRMRGMP
jgi:multidrug efflux pump subunit AcrA (membrane-fusion protein)/YHS domain-containing protein